MTEWPEILDEAAAIADDERGDVNRVAHPLRRRTDGRRGRGDAGGS